jgi:CheY-like chemotaxis protein
MVKSNDRSSQDRQKTRRDGDPIAVDGFTDDYLTGAVHDLRGSLNGIIGWADLIKRKALNEAGTAKAGETIIRQARQQLDLINELADTWRLLAGSLQLTLRPIDARELINSAILAAQQASQRDVHFDVQLDAMPAPWLVDGARLRQALSALFANAIHFAPDDGTVRVRLTSDRGMAELTVQDAGAGIDEEALPYLFNRQRPKDPAKNSSRAKFGRGLSFVRDIVDLHGGSINAESGGHSQGVTFRVSLPLQVQPQSARADKTREAEPAEQADEPSRLTGMSVLVVDDDPDAREVVAAILRRDGASVALATSAASALAVLARQPVDVIVSDIGMPVDDGYDLIRQIRALDTEAVAGIPAAALTAFTTLEDRDRALNAGFQAHLAKPVDSALLVATVERLCRPARPV